MKEPNTWDLIYEKNGVGLYEHKIGDTVINYVIYPSVGTKNTTYFSPSLILDFDFIKQMQEIKLS